MTREAADPLQNGDIFKVKNTAYLKSPVPHHILIKRQQQSALEHLQRPTPTYPPMNPCFPVKTSPRLSNSTIDTNSPAASIVGAQGRPCPLSMAVARKSDSETDFAFKIPSIPALSTKKSTSGTVKDNFQESSLASPSSINQALLPSKSVLDSLCNIDENINQLVDKIHESLTKSEDSCQDNVSDSTDLSDSVSHSPNALPTEVVSKQPEISTMIKQKRKRGRPRKNPLPGKPAENVAIKKEADSKPLQVLGSKTAGARLNSGKHYYFDGWWLRRVEYSKPGSVPIIVEGFMKKSESSTATQLWHSSLIVGISDSRTLKTGSGSCYHLDGDISRHAMKSNGFPDDLIAAFSKGFPPDWHEWLTKEKRDNFNEITTSVNKNSLDDLGRKKSKQPVIVKSVVKPKDESRAAAKKEIRSTTKVKQSKFKESRELASASGAPQYRKVISSSEAKASSNLDSPSIVSLSSTTARTRSSVGRSSVGVLKLEWGTGRVKIVSDSSNNCNRQLKSTDAIDATGVKGIEGERTHKAWLASEDEKLERLIQVLDPKSPNYWGKIVAEFPGRTEEDCRERSNFNFDRPKKQGIKVSSSSDLISKSKSIFGKAGMQKKRMIRQLIEERNREHQGDDLFERNTGEAESSSIMARIKSVPVPCSSKRKRTLNETSRLPSSSNDSDSSSNSSPDHGILQPVNVSDFDGYIKRIKDHTCGATKSLTKGSVKARKPLRRSTDRLAEDILCGRRQLNSDSDHGDG